MHIHSHMCPMLIGMGCASSHSLLAELQPWTRDRFARLPWLHSRASFVWNVVEVNEKCSERVAFLSYDWPTPRRVRLRRQPWQRPSAPLRMTGLFRSCCVDVTRMGTPLVTRVRCTLFGRSLWLSFCLSRRNPDGHYPRVLTFDHRDRGFGAGPV